MEHACSQCGTVVEDGSPFCPNCHAPQIKVPVRPPTAPVSEPLTPGTPEDVQPPAEPVLLEPDANDDSGRGAEPESGYGMEVGGGQSPEAPPPGAPPPSAPRPGRLMRRPAWHAAFIAGILAAVGTSIPVVPLALLCMFASGGLAVTLYRRRAGHQRVTPWMGAKLGVAAGGLGFGLLALMSAIRLFGSSERSALRTAFQAKMQQTIATATDPQVRQAMEQFKGYIATDRGLITMVLIFLAIAAVFFLIFSALGGALGAALFGRDGAPKHP